jgi:hypothetical protein
MIPNTHLTHLTRGFKTLTRLLWNNHQPESRTLLGWRSIASQNSQPCRTSTQSQRTSLPTNTIPQYLRMTIAATPVEGNQSPGYAVPQLETKISHISKEDNGGTCLAYPPPHFHLKRTNPIFFISLEHSLFYRNKPQEIWSVSRSSPGTTANLRISLDQILRIPATL